MDSNMTTFQTLRLSKDAWSGYAQQAQDHLPSHTRLFVLGLVNLPVFIVLVNVLWQFIAPRDSSLPPVVFHWFPILGSAIQYGNDPINFLLRCREKYGNVFTFILLGRKMTVTLGPKGNNFVLGGKLSQVSAEEAYTHLTTPVFGKDVVFDVPNDVFMQQKKFVKVGLSLENFRAYVGMIVDEVETFMANDNAFHIVPLEESSHKWGSFHVLKTMAQVTILTASRTLQGEEVRSKLDKTFAELYHDLDGGFTPLNFMFPNLPLESYRRRDKAQKEMSDFYVNILRNKVNGTSENNHDMITALMHQTYKDGRELTEREIAHLMIAMLMAGQHTSSASLSWVLLHIADNPDVGESLYQEQVKYFGTSGKQGHFRDLNYDELKTLPLLDAVIRETLRLHPPIHSIMRKVVSDIPVPATLSSASRSKKSNPDSGIPAYVVPKGYFVLSSPAVSQVDPQIWREPLRWDPSRWSDPEDIAAQALRAYVDEGGEKVDYGFGAVSKGTESPYQPFGAGRHRCIGEQIGTIIATLIRKIEMRLDKGMPAHNYHTMITVPKEPCNIKYRRRRID